MCQKARALAGWIAVCGGLLAVPRAAVPSEDPAVVALVIDTSGSVGRPGLARAKELVTGILSALGEGSEAAVFTFDDRSRLVLRRTGDAGAIRAALERAAVSGRGTALHDALYDAARYLREPGAGPRAIVLVTDGRDEGSALDLDDALEVAEEAHLPVFTVGVGRPNEKTLRRIAKLTGGDYTPAARARADTIAARIRAAAPLAAVGVPAPSRPERVAEEASPPAAPGAPAGEAGGAAPSDSPLPWVLAAVFALGLGAAWIAARRGRARPHCSRCGGALPAPQAPCPACDEASFVATSKLPAAAPELSPTVLARLSTTEEYLDRTIALQECPVLSITRGQGAGRTFELSRASALSVGRARAHDVVLEDVAVSSQHCRIRPESGGFVVHDLKSTNGTFVNDRRVSHHPLAEGDVIQIGETCLEYKLEHRRA